MPASPETRAALLAVVPLARLLELLRIGGRMDVLCKCLEKVLGSAEEDSRLYLKSEDGARMLPLGLGHPDELVRRTSVRVATSLVECDEDIAWLHEQVPAPSRLALPQRSVLPCCPAAFVSPRAQLGECVLGQGPMAMLLWRWLLAPARLLMHCWMHALRASSIRSCVQAPTRAWAWPPPRATRWSRQPHAPRAWRPFLPPSAARSCRCACTTTAPRAL